MLSSKYILSVAFIISLFTLQSQAIVNGSEVDEGEHPEIVKLAISENEILKKDLTVNNIERLSRCTGVAISDSQVLTAGHCARGLNNELNTIILVRKNKLNAFDLIQSQKILTNYKYEEPEKIIEKTIVPGCAPRVKSVTKTKTYDLALITFPEHTFEVTVEVDLNYKPQFGDSLVIYGFGVTKNSFINQMPIQDITSAKLHVMNSVIWRFNEQRLATFSTETGSYTDMGDSGAPVFHNNKVIATINTLEEKCETELGEDYGFTNTATMLSIDNVKKYILKVETHE